MTALHPPKDVKRRYLPPEAVITPVPGYDTWLASELAAGIADLDAENTTPLANMRKEFGLE